MFSSTETTEELQVNLRDCEKLIRNKVVGLPGGFTKSGHPLIVFPDSYRWFEVLETELHLLLKYYCHIIPRADQVCNDFLYHFHSSLREAVKKKIP